MDILEFSDDILKLVLRYVSRLLTVAALVSGFALLMNLTRLSCATIAAGWLQKTLQLCPSR